MKSKYLISTIFVGTSVFIFILFQNFSSDNRKNGSGKIVGQEIYSMIESEEDLSELSPELLEIYSYRISPHLKSNVRSNGTFSGNSGLQPLVDQEPRTAGVFGPLFTWPIMPIHMMFTPDGQVLAYGTDESGKQGAKMLYTVWDPKLGTAPSAFTTLPNITDTDVFCGGQALIPDTGQVLLVGGDAVVNGRRNYANSDVNIYNPTDKTISRVQSMNFKRWYSTAVTLPNGEHAILGGRIDKEFDGTSVTPEVPSTVDTYASTPELRAKNGSWRSLNSANSIMAYGDSESSWFYPRAWVNPTGGIFILGHYGKMFQLNLDASADCKANPETCHDIISQYNTTMPPSTTSLSSVMYSPGKILSLRQNGRAATIDLNNPGEPLVQMTGNLSTDRRYGTATVLADGKVWVNGGSSTGNDLAGVALDSEMWDPATGLWTKTASATTPRLYHSASLLLPDGTVLTGGGGAPGPANQLNGEIFYPPYLFKQNKPGELQTNRPIIKNSFNKVIHWNQTFTVKSNHIIDKITLVRVGAVTHTFNNETRFQKLNISALSDDGLIASVVAPVSADLAPPGFYMLFVWDTNGFPSVAKIIRLG